MDNDGFKYDEVMGVITAYSSNTIEVQYKYNNQIYTNQIENKYASENSIDSFILLYCNKDNPNIITYTNYYYNLKVALFNFVAFVLGLFAIIYILRMKYSLANDSCKIDLELIGNDRGSLVYVDRNNTDKPIRFFYTKRSYPENNYLELVANNKKHAYIIVSNKNSNWWCFDYTEIEEALK